MKSLIRFVCLSGVAGAVFLSSVPFVQALGFHPVAIANGEFWRLGTAHLVHLSHLHAMVNALWVGFIGTVLLEEISGRQLLTCALGIVVAIDVVFLLPMPHCEVYFAGFSSVLYGLTMLAAILAFKHSKLWSVILGTGVLISFMLGALGWHGWNFDIATGPHLVGTICGMVAGVSLMRPPEKHIE